MRQAARVSRRFGSIICAPGYRKHCRGTQTVMPRHPVRRDLSFPSLPSLEYWIVRPSAQLRTRRTMTPNMHPRSRGAGRARGLTEALAQRRAQGRPGARCTRGLVCNVHREVRTRAYRSSGEHPAFPAQWLYGLCRDLPGEPSSVATVTSQIRSAKLGASFGRQNHTISPYACATRVSRSTRVHRTPPHVRDDRETPL